MKFSFGLLLLALAVPAVQAWNLFDIINPFWWATQAVLAMVNVVVDVDGTVCSSVESLFANVLSCTCSTEGEVFLVVPTAVTATATCSVTDSYKLEIGDQSSPAAVLAGTFTMQVTAQFGELLNQDFSNLEVKSVNGCWTTAHGDICPTYTGFLTISPLVITITTCSIGTSSGGSDCNCSICSGNVPGITYSSCSGVEDTCVFPALITPVYED